jgi:hypothetical protein
LRRRIGAALLATSTVTAANGSEPAVRAVLGEARRFIATAGGFVLDQILALTRGRKEQKLPVENVC